MSASGHYSENFTHISKAAGSMDWLVNKFPKGGVERRTKTRNLDHLSERAIIFHTFEEHTNGKPYANSPNLLNPRIGRYRTRAGVAQIVQESEHGVLRDMACYLFLENGYGAFVFRDFKRAIPKSRYNDIRLKNDDAEIGEETLKYLQASVKKYELIPVMFSQRQHPDQHISDISPKEAGHYHFFSSQEDDLWKGLLKKSVRSLAFRHAKHSENSGNSYDKINHMPRGQYVVGIEKPIDTPGIFSKNNYAIEAVLRKMIALDAHPNAIHRLHYYEHLQTALMGYRENNPGTKKEVEKHLKRIANQRAGSQPALHKKPDTKTSTGQLDMF